MNKRALEFELQNFDYMVYLCWYISKWNLSKLKRLDYTRRRKSRSLILKEMKQIK